MKLGTTRDPAQFQLREALLQEHRRYQTEIVENERIAFQRRVLRASHEQRVRSIYSSAPCGGEP
jgi:hypothetical protein